MRRRLMIIVVLLVLGAGGYALWRFVLAPPALAPGVIPVSGRIEGDDSAVAAKTTGRVRAIAVREGDHVESGQVIARLDDEQVRAREQQAEAAVRQATAHARVARHQIEVLNEQLQQSRLGVDQSRTDAEGKVHEAEGRLAAAEAQLAQAEAAHAQAKWDRDANARLFQRELIAERTRDKMRAARRKGKWLGGQPILGYDVDPERRGLKIHAEEAQRVRWIFQWIAEAKSAEEVLGGLARQGWTTKQWISRSGRQHPGRAFQESDLARLVQNVTYLGKLREGKEVYQGEHAEIVEAELWQRANTAVSRWQTSAQGRRHRSPNTRVERAGGVTGPPSVPRISRLLALALQMEQMMQEGTVRNYSELAHLGQVSAARISQVMNLLHLAPDIQEEILFGHTPQARWRESALRKLSAVVLWSQQRDRWHKLVAAASVQKHPSLRPCLRPATQLGNLP